jgi:predicted RNA binding protein YcfA (HicA-like mRNA interferase family)
MSLEDSSNSDLNFIVRLAGSDEIWHNVARNRYTTIPNHSGDMSAGTLRAILTQAVATEKFLQSK